MTSPDDELVERVAKAICCGAAGEGCAGDRGNLFDPYGKPMPCNALYCYGDDARVAVAVVLEEAIKAAEEVGRVQCFPVNEGAWCAALAIRALNPKER